MSLLRYKISKFILILSGLLYLIKPNQVYSESLFGLERNRRINNNYLERIRKNYRNNIENRKRKKENEIIFRGNILYGLGNSNNKKIHATTTATMFSIDNIGFGKTLTKLESQIGLSRAAIEYSTNDLYLIFGRSNTFAFGLSELVKGELQLNINENIFKSNKFSGNGYSFIFGTNIGIFEILGGYKYINYKIKEIKINDTKMNNKENSLSQTIIGVGIKY